MEYLRANEGIRAWAKKGVAREGEPLSQINTADAADPESQLSLYPHLGYL